MKEFAKAAEDDIEKTFEKAGKEAKDFLSNFDKSDLEEAAEKAEKAFGGKKGGFSGNAWW